MEFEKSKNKEPAGSHLGAINFPRRIEGEAWKRRDQWARERPLGGGRA